MVEVGGLNPRPESLLGMLYKLSFLVKTVNWLLGFTVSVEPFRHSESRYNTGGLLRDVRGRCQHYAKANAGAVCLLAIMNV
jgi:hypothetical protein